MAPQLGGSQISALLESVPGIASVLRSPVADALVGMIRAGAGIGPFKREDAEELVQYAVRRGLISADEGDELLRDVRAASRGRSRPRAAAGGKRKARARAAKPKKAPKKRARKTVKKARKKAAKRR